MMLARAVLRMSDADALLMRRVQRWTPARWLRWWMLAATRAGDGWLWALAGAAVLASGSESSGRAFCAAVAAVTCGIVLFSFLKRVVNRRRPCWFERQSWHNLLPPDQFSFPSGHSITAFAVAVSLGSFYPAAWAGLAFCAASVAASRVVLGMHYLSDVIAGCAVGAGLGYAAFWWLGLP
jgi:undecaprenyl-diphosphatase